MKNKKNVHKRIAKPDSESFLILDMAEVGRWFGAGAVEDLKRQGYILDRAELKAKVWK